jgi:hypothetical protein
MRGSDQARRMSAKRFPTSIKRADIIRKVMTRYWSLFIRAS